MDGGVQMRCLFGDALQQIRHVVGAVEFRSQCDDIATLADAEVIPLVEFGVYLNEASASSLSGDLYQRLLSCRLTGVYPRLCR